MRDNTYLDVLVSIRKPHTDNIFDNKKLVEWRTQKMPLGRHYCYESKSGGGAGKVIGEYIVAEVLAFPCVDAISNEVIALGCVSREFLREYSRGKTLYAHVIVRAKRYETPLELGYFFKPCIKSGYPWCFECEYGLSKNEPRPFGVKRYFDVPCQNYRKRPPQSWYYVQTAIKGGKEKCSNG